MKPVPDQVIVSGGGAMNRRIMEGLRSLTRAELLSTGDLGIKSEAKEALAFALLGAATLDGVPSNVKSVTGARRGVVLGSITPAP
jgi:anhydro-N-acetylmuramic acid kinase